MQCRCDEEESDGCLVAPSAFSCRRAAFALSVVCLLKVATLTYASLPEASVGPTELLAPSHIWEVTGFSVIRCLVSLTVLGLFCLLTSKVTYMQGVEASLLSIASAHWDWAVAR